MQKVESGAARGFMNLIRSKSHPLGDLVSEEEAGGCRQTLLGNNPGAPRGHAWAALRRPVNQY